MIIVLCRSQVQIYRFSISWSRLLPNGTLAGGVNEDGIEFYQSVINALIENGTVHIKMTANYMKQLWRKTWNTNVLCTHSVESDGEGFFC